MDLDKLHEILRSSFGHSSFRSNQLEIIEYLLNGNDTLALLPTGGGKSLCYQIPALYLNSRCLVISPLIALMEDQVNRLKKSNISAHTIHSGKSPKVNLQTFNQFIAEPCSFLYISPERVLSTTFIEMIRDTPISHIAIDEAHCISQWGYDFRPSYLGLDKLKETFPGVPLIALTATATAKVINEIVDLLNMENPNIVSSSFKRNNIALSVINNAQKKEELLELIKANQGSGIVYMRSRRGVKNISSTLKYNGVKASHYHGKMSFDERTKIAEEWNNNSIQIVASTNAFGMGIDKHDVRSVTHLDIPPSIEEYYQEAGRAGRDGEFSLATLFYDNEDIEKVKRNNQIALFEPEDVTLILNKLGHSFKSSENNTISPFFLREWSSESNMPPHKTLNILIYLQKCGILYLSDGILNPSRVMFQFKGKDQVIFSDKEPEHFKLAAFLLQNYDYLFDMPVVIIEERLAQQLQKETSEIIAMIRQLEGEGHVFYECRTQPPELIFNSRNPQAIDSRYINWYNDSVKRKSQSMLDYIATEKCRMQFILGYFGEESQPCGNCDLCQASKKINEVEWPLKDLIRRKIDAGPVSVRSLLTQMNNFNKKKMLATIRAMENEKFITIENGAITEIHEL